MIVIAYHMGSEYSDYDLRFRCHPGTCEVVECQCHPPGNFYIALSAAESCCPVPLSKKVNNTRVKMSCGSPIPVPRV